jgi:Lon-like ATP-dependent protease
MAGRKKKEIPVGVVKEVADVKADAKADVKADVKADAKADVKSDVQSQKAVIDVLSMKSWTSFTATDQIKVPERLIDQVVGQEKAVETITKAASQRRHVLLIGEPGTGKSMLAKAMAEMLPCEELSDILSLPNQEDENAPHIAVVKAGEGRKIIKEEREREMEFGKERSGGMFLPFLIILIALVAYLTHFIEGSVAAALIIFGTLLLMLFVFNMRSVISGKGVNVPRIIVDNAERKMAPFFDGTGAHAGALLGDVKHDPLQTGGLGTPAHLRVVAGLIHKANKGVLYIDEVGGLGKSQQDLLTAMQEKKLLITGRSEMSSGAMVITDPVPCDFILVASGNIHVLEQMHPALRSRIRGYGYEVHMELVIKDNELNRKKLVQFVAQEVSKDKKIPHFKREAVEEIIREAQRKAGVKGKLTVRFRELGGLIRAAGDIAVEKKHPYVTQEDVMEGKKSSRTLEQQIADTLLEKKKEYNILITRGKKVGRVNGLAVMGDGGTVLPIVSEVSPSQSKRSGTIFATGKLGEIAKEAVTNVSALFKNMSGKDISSHDIHIQFLQTYEGVEGDSASVSVAVAVISALESVPVKQDVGMTGSLTVRGEVLPVGGITQKVEAAIDAGLRKVIIPFSNKADLFLEKKYEGKIEIVTAKTLIDVLKHSLYGGERVIERMRKIIG